MNKINELRFNMIQGREEIINRYKQISERFEKECSRGVCVLLSELLDVTLSDLLSLRLVNKDNMIKDFITGTNFDNRIKLSYLVGIIKYSEYEDLQIIRNIRNKFAHISKKHLPDFSFIKHFEDKDISSLINKLNIMKIARDARQAFDREAGTPSHGEFDYRQKFVLASSIILLFLNDRFQKIAKINEFKFI